MVSDVPSISLISATLNSYTSFKKMQSCCSRGSDLEMQVKQKANLNMEELIPGQLMFSLLMIFMLLMDLGKLRTAP